MNGLHVERGASTFGMQHSHLHCSPGSLSQGLATLGLHVILHHASEPPDPERVLDTL